MTGADVEINFGTPEFLECPYPAYATARSEGRVARVAGQGSMLVVRYDDVRHVAHHTELFSSHRPVLGAGDPEFEAIAAEGYPDVATLVTNDPPDHTSYRKLLSRRFSARYVGEIEPMIRRMADELIDGFLDSGSVELITEFGVPFPLRVFGSILGASPDDQANFRRWADAIADTTSSFITRERALECKRTVVELQHYFAGELERRRAEPSDDLMSDLANASRNGEPLEMAEMIDMLRILLAGGVETTASVITTGVYLLLSHPEQLAEVRADHALLPQMIEETLRFEAPVQWNPRLIEKEGVEVGGVEVPVGSRVMIGWASANRDATHYGDAADQFDIHRGASDHMAFGHGVHFCLGAALARAEVRIALEQLLDRLPNLRAAQPLEQLRFSGPFIRRLEALPLAFDRPSPG